MVGAPQLPSAESVRWRSWRRIALWLLLVVVVGATVAAAVRAWTQDPPPEPPAIPWTTQTEWSAVGVDFARRFLTWNGSPEAWGESVEQLYRGPELEAPEASDRTEVTAAQMIYLQPIGEGRALVTVQATVRAIKRDRTVTRVLVIPVFRSGEGSASVYDAPSVAPPLKVPDKTVTDAIGEIPDAELAPLESTVTRFVGAYLTGEDYSLAVAPGASVSPQPAALKVLDIGALEPLDLPSTESGHIVVAVRVRATDLDINRDVRLRLLIELVKQDRWQVVRVLG